MKQSHPSCQEMMAQLIAAPSISSTNPDIDQSNLGVIELLESWLSGIGFEVQRQPIPGKEGKANLIGVLGRGTGGLVLAGHTDTVPCDADLWSEDPFTLTGHSDRWYGLGTCDMKGFFALAIEAAKEYDANDLEHPLIVVATADEESSMSGARALRGAELCGARSAIIGEPTSLTPIYQTKGIMMLRVRIEGSSGHSSNPALGRSALDGTLPVLASLLDYRRELAGRKQDLAYRVAAPTMNLGCIRGGDNPNRICDHVEIEIDVRVLPGMSNEAIKAELAERLGALEGDLALGIEVDFIHAPVPPFASEMDEEMLATIEGLTHSSRDTAAFASEAPFLQGMGIDTLLLGPGCIDQAHQPDEFIELAQLEPAIAIMRRLIQHHCSS